MARFSLWSGKLIALSPANLGVGTHPAGDSVEVYSIDGEREWRVRGTFDEVVAELDAAMQDEPTGPGLGEIAQVLREGLGQA